MFGEAGTRAVPTTLEPKWLRVVEKLDPERMVQAGPQKPSNHVYYLYKWLPPITFRTYAMTS